MSRDSTPHRDPQKSRCRKKQPREPPQRPASTGTPKPRLPRGRPRSESESARRRSPEEAPARPVPRPSSLLPSPLSLSPLSLSTLSPLAAEEERAPGSVGYRCRRSTHAGAVKTGGGEWRNSCVNRDGLRRSPWIAFPPCSGSARFPFMLLSSSGSASGVSGVGSRVARWGEDFEDNGGSPAKSNEHENDK